MTFAAITVALISGAVVERMKFSSWMVFIVAWVSLVYVPIAHWVWGGGFLFHMGALDFAGGTVVHINSGVAALALVLLLGKRKDTKLLPHHFGYSVIGAALLWFGWFGFNAGSALNCWWTGWICIPSNQHRRCRRYDLLGNNRLPQNR